MAFGKTLKTKLLGTAALTALVGQRIYPNTFPDQPDTPAIRYSLVSAVRPSAMSVDVGLTRFVYQFNVIAPTYDTADSARIQLLAALRRWRTTGVQDSFVQTETDSYDDDVKLHNLRVDIEFIVED